MSDSMDTSDNTDSNISFIISNKAQKLLVVNANVYKCNKKNGTQEVLKMYC